jgi:hypothetical protein
VVKLRGRLGEDSGLVRTEYCDSASFFVTSSIELFWQPTKMYQYVLPIVLPLVGGYVLSSLVLLHCPELIHMRKKSKFRCRHISHRGGKASITVSITVVTWAYIGSHFPFIISSFSTFYIFVIAKEGIVIEVVLTAVLHVYCVYIHT